MNAVRSSGVRVVWTFEVHVKAPLPFRSFRACAQGIQVEEPAFRLALEATWKSRPSGSLDLSS